MSSIIFLCDGEKLSRKSQRIAFQTLTVLVTGINFSAESGGEKHKQHYEEFNDEWI